MKRILATTALAVVLSGSAFAASHTMKLDTYQVEQAGDIYASEFIGMRVYAAEKDFDSMNETSSIAAGDEKNWDDIGEVNDVILGRDGSVRAVILGVGGFIGIGEKDVAINMSAIKMVQEKDDADDFFLVVKANKQSLTDADAYEKVTEAEMMKENVEKDAEIAMKKTEDAMTGIDRPMLIAPSVERDGYVNAKMEDLTADTLTGARVYGSDDEDVGEIDRLVLSDEGKIKHAIIDVGGFLGMGERPIAVTMDELKILRQDGGDDVRIFIEATQAELEKQPIYEG